MANFLSLELTNALAAAGTGVTGPVLNAANREGKLVRRAFKWTAPAGVLIGDTTQLIKVPARSIIYGGRIDFGAFGAACTLALGDGTTAAKYLAATSVAAAGQADFANTAALSGVGQGGEIAVPGFTLTGTWAGANPLATFILQGYIDFLLS